RRGHDIGNGLAATHPFLEIHRSSSTSALETRAPIIVRNAIACGNGAALAHYRFPRADSILLTPRVTTHRRMSNPSTPTPLVLDAATVARLLPWPALIEALADAFR